MRVHNLSKPLISWILWRCVVSRWQNSISSSYYGVSSQICNQVLPLFLSRGSPGVLRLDAGNSSGTGREPLHAGGLPQDRLRLKHDPESGEYTASIRLRTTLCIV